ncbi:acyltransferase family protein [Caproiciproducens faecalis]|uniref:Acyltransferase family protein n=1 Tax=Caproiciproducens faecalis TaxID=2820301 RepID=A0ABS7DJB5_9FIRM|nr:acyltransferase family protein [Caproiciproducens faecalis]MBW7571313.1 acyltransferase family protein [Caproiciproducens faecalis]
MSIELLRILLMLMIVTLHYLGHGGMLDAVSPGGGRYVFVWTLETFSYIGVNGFILISGYYLAGSAFKMKKLIGLIIQIVSTSAAIYLIFVAAGLAPFTKGQLFGAFFPVITGKYWFATSYIALYCLFPFLNMVVKTATKQQMQILVFLLSAMFCSWNAFFPPLTIMSTNGGYNVVWMVCLYFFAAYLRLYWDHQVNKFLYLAGAVLCCVFVAWKKCTGSDAFLSYVSVPITLAAILLFLFFREASITNRAVGKVISFVSPLTFGVYLISDNTWVRRILYTNILHTSLYFESSKIVYMIPASVLGIFVVSMLLEQVRKLLLQPFLESAAYQKFCDWISGLKFLQGYAQNDNGRAA